MCRDGSDFAERSSGKNELPFVHFRAFCAQFVDGVVGEVSGASDISGFFSGVADAPGERAIFAERSQFPGIGSASSRRRGDRYRDFLGFRFGGSVGGFVARCTVSGDPQYRSRRRGKGGKWKTVGYGK